MARIHFRGQVNRQLRGLRFEAGSKIECGATAEYEGREAGMLTSLAQSPLLGCPIALAMLHRRAAAPGTRIQLAGSEVEGEVVEVPFVAWGDEAGDSGT